MTNSVAVIVAHSDDEVLGCGGTLARLAGEGRAVHVLVLADGETSRSMPSGEPVDSGRLAARSSAARKASSILGCASVSMLGLPDNRLDGIELLDLVKHVEEFVRRHRPTTVFTHHSGDVNIDHRVVHDAVITACRPQPDESVREILFFEAISSTEWRPPASAAPFNPNYFVDISATLAKKQEALQAYESEMRAFPHVRSFRAVTALAEWRGATVGVEAAEAFVVGRQIIK